MSSIEDDFKAAFLVWSAHVKGLLSSKMTGAIKPTDLDPYCLCTAGTHACVCLCTHVHSHMHTQRHSLCNFLYKDLG